MKRPTTLAHEFVSVIPERLEDNTLYVSVEYATAVHKCLCGCGHEVVTPLSPTDWKLTFDGVSVSLYPSIGNWRLDCQSHYWIANGRVKWAEQWSKERIRAGRMLDCGAKVMHYSGDTKEPIQKAKLKAARKGFFSRLLKWQ